MAVKGHSYSKHGAIRWCPAGRFPSRAPLGHDDKITQQHSNRKRTNASRNRTQKSRLSLNALSLYVTHECPSLTRRSGIEYDGTFLHHGSGNEARSSRTAHDDVGT